MGKLVFGSDSTAGKNALVKHVKTVCLEVTSKTRSIIDDPSVDTPAPSLSAMASDATAEERGKADAERKEAWGKAQGVRKKYVDIAPHNGKLSEAVTRALSKLDGSDEALPRLYLPKLRNATRFG